MSRSEFSGPRRPMITRNPDGTLTVAVGPLAENPGDVTPLFPEPYFTLTNGVRVFMAPGALDQLIAFETKELKKKLAAQADPKTASFDDLMPVAALQTAKQFLDGILSGEMPDPEDVEDHVVNEWALVARNGQTLPDLVGRPEGSESCGSLVDGVMAMLPEPGGWALVRPCHIVALGQPAPSGLSFTSLFTLARKH